MIGALKRVKPKYWIGAVIFMAAFLFWWFSLPSPLFSAPTSTVIESRNGELLGAHIATDGQWRFPEVEAVPEKYKACVLAFEDRHFYRHPGFNPVSLTRALVQNIRNGRVVSGGSTITMQLIRLSRKGKERTIWQKLIELSLAVRAELSYSKEELLRMYVSNAPFGGNVVGLDAAAWRYFGRNAADLSWAESATLAVLPNAPSLIYPGKRNELLAQKRNRLLDLLFKRGQLDETTLNLAKLEPLPMQVYAIPQTAPHLLNRALEEHPGERIQTTVDRQLQQHVNDVVRQHLVNLRANEVHNAAVLVLNVEKGEVLAYVGNSPDRGDGQHGEQVDVITSPRSSGSILKPFLYAAMQDDGLILPQTLIPDIPTQIGGFSPQNFNLQFEGAVPASMALSKSLNIPAVRMLRDYGVERFYSLLRELHFSSLDKPASHYGLSLILGGAEVKLWDLAGAYSSLARMLVHYEEQDGVIFEDDFRAPEYTPQNHSETEISKKPISLAAAWLTFEALLKVNRPDEESGWQSFSSSRQVAWKTGTSFGFRDGWAVGVDRNYLVAVWCGNADGEGRPGLTGTSAAAPLMFDVFNLLPASRWFTQPVDEMVQIPVCHESGYRLGAYCEQADTIWVTPKGLGSAACPFHRMVHLDPTGSWQVTTNCYPVDEMIHEKWFVLPPVMEWYYKRRNLMYRLLPPFKPGCTEETQAVIEMIYPRENNKVFVPVQLDGKPGQVILEAAHSSPDAIIFWHLDDKYLGQTSGDHQMPINPEPGEHSLNLIDDSGNTFTKKIVVAEK
ncbi:penicillin-binding protein 1C [Mangrovibacterium diazotrophicum]|uniref:peptidoglycan glycosyltransferase n=1 Tax=Mangrovibacterium diazotrophicum TaxID=1261403 RepID=A0A419WB79_9BACT|nr:penicillin-binding protein 1C [Mangrovibacterium diazotrophicum]RKD92725.1 penicillin-binding protein 1C [Mangrovibacterium diazotrophicum]